MVTDRTTRYLGGSDGAPPLPPPGGYRGASRLRGIPGVTGTNAAGPGGTAATGDAAGPDGGPTAAPSRAGRVWGPVALAVTVLFALVLIVLALLQAVPVIFGVTMLVVQLLVLGVVVAALVAGRPRGAATVALAIALVLNVGTVGALAAVTSPTPGTDGTITTTEDRHWQAYPGVKDTYGPEAVSDPSLEQTRTDADAVLAAMRDALTERFGYAWVEGVPERVAPVRNGYGGESMLSEFWSTEWVTTQPITDLERKYEVMAVIEQVLVASGWSEMYSFNDPSSGLDPSLLETFYGSAEVSTQVEWEWTSRSFEGPSRMYAILTDLTHDDTGDFRAAREAVRAGTDAPPEGLSLIIRSEPVLPEADRDDYADRIDEY